MLTEAGFRLQVGMSLTVDMEVVTLQVMFTVPVNPFVPATLIVPVFPVVAPGASVMEVVPPLPAVKLGSAVMVSSTLVMAVSESEDPVMFTVNGEEVTCAEAPTVRVSVWVPAAESGANEAVTPLGRPVAESLTAPEKPPNAPTVMILVPLLP